MLKTLTIFFIVTILSGFIIKSALAAGLEGIDTYTVVDDKAVDGDIMITTKDGLIRADVPYDNRLFGILTDRPVVVYRSDATSKPVVRTGTAQVNVTNANGPIKSGDLITSSENPGKGVRAISSGYTIGSALTELNGTGSQSGQITVAVRIEFSEISTARSVSRLLEYISNAFFKDTRESGKFTDIVRYVVAGVVLLISFLFAFVTFSKSVPKAIEAIGRNPLARNFIYVSLILNIGLIVLVVGLGILSAVIIIQTK